MTTATYQPFLIIPCQMNGEPMNDWADGYFCPVYFW